MSTDTEKKEGKVKEMKAPDTKAGPGQEEPQQVPIHFVITQEGINKFIAVANTVIPNPHLKQAAFSSLQAQLKPVFAELEPKPE